MPVYKFRDNKEYDVSSAEDLWRQIQQENSMSRGKPYTTYLRSRAVFIRRFYELEIPENATANEITAAYLQLGLATKTD